MSLDITMINNTGLYSKIYVKNYFKKLTLQLFKLKFMQIKNDNFCGV